MTKFQIQMILLMLFMSCSHGQKNERTIATNNNLMIGDYHCNYYDDKARGVTVVRVVFSVFEDKKACFSFYKNKSYIVHKTCGDYTRRTNGSYGDNFNFLGFPNFISKSHVSIPSSSGNDKRFSVQLEHHEENLYELRIGPKGKAADPNNNLVWSVCKFVGESDLLN